MRGHRYLLAIDAADAVMSETTALTVVSRTRLHDWTQLRVSLGALPAPLLEVGARLRREHLVLLLAASDQGLQLLNLSLVATGIDRAIRNERPLVGLRRVRPGGRTLSRLEDRRALIG